MVSNNKFSELASRFPEVSESPHFDTASFRIKKKIFATLDGKKRRACLRLSPADQDLFEVGAPDIIYPVPNKWGQQGWTFVDLRKVKTNILISALTAAYKVVAPKKFQFLLPDQ